MTTIHQYTSIKNVPDNYWLHKKNGPFHQKKFLQVLERSNVENATYQYIVISENTEIIASAVFSIFTIDITLFIGKSKLVQLSKTLFPNLFNIKLLFCGTPISLGHSNIEQTQLNGNSIEQLAIIMQSEARANGIKYMVIKELNSKITNNYNGQLKKLGWFIGHSLPDTKMQITWCNYTDYLNCLKSSYRRQIFHNLSLDTTSTTIENANLILDKSTKTSLANEISIDEFYEKYLDVLSRSKTKLETLNLEFFKHFFKTYHKEIIVFYNSEIEDERCYLLCMKHGDELHFLWTAKKENAKANRAYLLLMQSIIKYGIDHKYTLIHFGQTSYYPKMRIGAFPQERYILFKCLNPLRNIMFRMLSSFIFPQIKTPFVNPFKVA